MSSDLASADDLANLHQIILDNTEGGDLFWIGEILLDVLERETGFKERAQIAARCARVDTALAAQLRKSIEANIALRTEAGQLRAALGLATSLLFKHEPPDSRAVSDEFVALCCVEVGDCSGDVMAVIASAIAKLAAETPHVF